MVRYQVILVYDGTEFRGFQRQANARTVQGAVEAALREIGWQGPSILSAGRTDTGVHASGQVVAFDLDWGHTPEKLRSALNNHLPLDVAAQAVSLAAPGFHPRHKALARRYRYRLFCRPVRDPLKERYAWRIWPAVDLACLQAAAVLLPGTHDFAAFGTPPRSKGRTVRDLMEAHWRVDGEDLIFDVVANAFLYHMVRRLVFAQVAVAQGKLELETLRSALEEPQPKKIKGLAPPQGLTLIKVLYSDNLV